MFSKCIKNAKYKYIVLCLVLIFSSSSFFYSDANATIRQGIDVWHALFSGNIFTFYSDYGSAYGMIMVIIMGVWQFPLFLIEKIFHINVLDFFAFKIYGKLQLILVAWVAATYVKKIAIKLSLSERKAEYAFFMYLTSIPIMTTICQVGQVDIFGMAFTIIAYYYLITNNNKWMFYLFFSIAVQCKYIAWFILVPVVLFIQKKLWKAIIIISAPLVISFLINVPFSQKNANDIQNIQYVDSIKNVSVNEVEEEIFKSDDIEVSSIIGAGNSDNKIVSAEFYNFLSRPIDLIDSNFPIPLLFLLYVAICFVAFIKDPDDETKNWWYLYWGFIGSASVITCLQLPYRMGYIIFFTILFVLKQEHNFGRQLTLEIFAYAALIIGHFASCAWLYDLNNMRGMLIDNILPLKKFALSGIEDIRQMVLTNHMERLWSIFFAIFIVWIIVVLWMSYPDRKVRCDVCDCSDEAKESNRLILIRTVVNLLLCNYAVLLYAKGVICNILDKFL